MRQKFGLFTSILMIAAGVLACHFVESMGVLSANGQPVTFTAKGETDQFWQAEVIVGATYELTVSPENVTGQDDGASILICERSGDICPKDSMIAVVSTLRDGASTIFSSPNSTTIFIHVTTLLGEGGQEVGTFQITLRQVH